MTVLAQNLNYAVDSSWCYENEEANCKLYGRLYSWNTANQACPAGWRLLSEEEWARLSALWNDSVADYPGRGNDLKSALASAAGGWYFDGSVSSDVYGFSALPGGYGIGGSFFDARFSGYWWTSTVQGADSAFVRYMWHRVGTLVASYSAPKRLRVSVRCVKD
jgi:uncharacterized protein (TIGR02145 family)